MQEIRRESALAFSSSSSSSSSPSSSSNTADDAYKTGFVGYDEDGNRTLHTGLQGILRGAWKAFDREGLWNLEELESQRAEAVRAFGNLGRLMGEVGRVGNSAK